MTSPLPSAIEMIATLVATPSMSSVNRLFDTSNEPVCAKLAEFLAAAGCRAELKPIDGHSGKVNLLAQFGSGPPGLALCGHTDTVPYDEERWQHDPFGCERVDEKMYGLGSSDMKGFLAICAAALASFSSAKLSRSVVLLGSADEESSMSGARALVDAGEHLAPFAVVGEPTGLVPVRQHKGTLMESIRITGRSGHSSNPALGANAIDAMYEVIGALKAWREQLKVDHHDDSFDVPYPTLNFGHVRGGDNPNRICADCELYVDLRVMPGMTVANARTELRQRVADALDGAGVEVAFNALFVGADPLSTAPDSAIVRACEAHSGCTAGSVNFCTEGPFFSALGAQTVVFGPGDIDLAHQPNEYLDLRYVEPTQRAIVSLVEQFCG